MMIMRRAAAVLLFCCAVEAQAPTEPTPQPASTPEDLVRGERMYRTQCAYCHGPRGEGGRGATLARPRLLHAPDDAAMFRAIARGIPDSEMAGFWLTAGEIWQVVAYVRTLGRVASEEIAGDPANGAKLYAGKGGCSRCHTVRGRGGALGPDLSDIGARRSAAYLRDALVAPEAAVPNGFLQVQLVTRDRRRITGVRLNEDAFSIQIRDLAGDFRSFFKNELAELHRQPGKSPMQGYAAVFTASELNDVVAYLDTLRNAP